MKRNNNITFYISIVVIVCALLISIFASTPMKSPENEIPADQFSGERALEWLTFLLKEQVPHFSGSEANRVVRDRIINKLSSWGYDPSIQKTFGEVFFQRFAYAENILATLPGKVGDSSILLVAHYDSVRASMNSRCDGTGIATLMELARTMINNPKMDHDIIFFFADTEETGLQGSQGFVRDNPELMDKIKAVISFDLIQRNITPNITSRGPKSGLLENIFLKSSDRPFGNSNAPSYTDQLDPKEFGDIGSFVEKGISGFHIGGSTGPEYHTPLENLEILGPDHLYDVGTKITAVLKVAGNTNFAAGKKEQLVYFDFASLISFSWDESFTLILTLSLLILLVAVLLLFFRNNILTIAQFLWGLLNSVLIFLSGMGLAFLLNSYLPVFAGSKIAYPGNMFFLLLVIWILPFFITTLFSSILTKRSQFWGNWFGSMGLIAVTGLIFSFVIKGGTFPMIIPVAIGLCIAICGLIFKKPAAAWFKILIVSIPLFTLAVLIFESLIIIHDVAGITDLLFPSLFMLLLSLVWSSAISESSKRLVKTIFISISCILILSLAAIKLIPSYNADHPISMNLFYIQNADNNEGYFSYPDISNKTSDLMKDLKYHQLNKINAPFNQWLKESYYTRQNHPGWIASAESVPIDPPGIEILETAKTQNGRIVKLRIFSPRKANQLGLLLPPETRRLSTTVNELKGIHNGQTSDEWRAYEFFAVPDIGIEIEIELIGDEKIKTYIFDCEFDLPPSADPLLSKRPDWGTKKDRGDRWFIFKSISF